MVPQYVHETLTLTNHKSGYTHHGYTNSEFTQAKAVAKATKNSAFNDTKQDINICKEREREREREIRSYTFKYAQKITRAWQLSSLIAALWTCSSKPSHPDLCIVNMFIQTLCIQHVSITFPGDHEHRGGAGAGACAMQQGLRMFQVYKQYLHAWHIHMYMHHCMYTCTHAMFMICALALYW